MMHRRIIYEFEATFLIIFLIDSRDKSKHGTWIFRIGRMEFISRVVSLYYERNFIKRKLSTGESGTERRRAVKGRHAGAKVETRENCRGRVPL